MRNLTFKAAMLNDSRTTVNRQSTDGQSQRHYKQTPLSKRWKVLMTLVFLFTFAIGNVWAALTAHTPGVYEKTTDKGGYGATIVTVSSRDYEVYGFSYNSSGTKPQILWAGTSTNNASASQVLCSNLSTTSQEIAGWISMSTAGKSSTYSMPSSTEFAASSVGSTGLYQMKLQGHSFTIKVKGYDQFSFLGNDNNANKTKEKYLQVTINGSDVTKDLNSSTTVRRYDLNASIESTIVITGLGESNEHIDAFSLRLPEAPTCSTEISTQPSGATIAVGDANPELSIVATNVASYAWKESSDGTSYDGASSLGSSASFTPSVNDAVQTKYYYCEVKSSCDGAAVVKSNIVTINVVGAISYYTVTLNPAGGTIVDATGWTLNAGNYEKEVAEGTVLTLPTFTKTDRAFKTWRNAVPADVTSPITVTADVTLTAVWNATVEQVIYSWESPSGTVIETGGTAVTYKGDDPVDGDPEVNVLNNGNYVLQVSGDNTASSSKNHIRITLTSGNAVKSGDKVKLIAYANNPSNNTRPRLIDGSGNQLCVAGSNMPAYTDPYIGTLTVADGINTELIKLTRASGYTGTNTMVKKLQIIRPTLVEEANIRTVTFNYNDGGATANKVVEVASGSKVSAEAAPSYAHHRFHEWQLGGVAYDFSTAVTSNIILTADWTQLYTVTYAKGEESATGDAPTQDELAAGEKFTVAANPFAYEGHDFSTWNDGSKDVAPASEYTMGSANVTLTAQWITATTKVTVTYKDGETTLGSEEITINTGNPVGYATYQTRNLATFDGWYNDPDLAEGHKIADISTLTASANVNVYGKWNYQYATSVNIEQWTLDNGKGVSDAQKEAQTGALMSLMGNRNYSSGIAYDKGNIELDSLNDDPSKTNRNYAYLGLKVRKSGKMLDFRLAKDSYVKVKFGNVAATPKVSINGADYADMEITDGVYSYTATGNDYISIKTASDGAVVFKQIMINEPIADVTLPWRVTYDANGGTCATAEAIWSGAALILPDVTPADADHTFAGWYDEVSGGSLQGAAGASYTPTDNTTLHAQFAPVEYSVTYVGGEGATGSMGPEAKGWGLEYTALANTFEKSGHVFSGWTVTGVDGVSTIPALGSFTMPKNPVTLTAIWTDNSKVAQIVETNVKYESFAAAIAAVQADQTIQLLQDCEYSTYWDLDGSALTGTKTVTLDLNGKNLTYTGTKRGVQVSNGGKLVLMDGTATVAPTIDLTTSPMARTAINYTSGVFDSKDGMCALAGSEIIINSGRYLATEGVVLVVGNAATVTVNDGVLISRDNGVLMGNGTNSDSYRNYVMNIHGGILYGEIFSAGYASMVVYHPNVGELNIDGGILVSTNGPCVVTRGGETNITGGTLVALGSGSGKCGDASLVLPAVGIAVDFKSAYPGVASTDVAVSGTVDVTGQAGAVEAVYAAATPTAIEESKVNISGGTFNTELTNDLCAPGYIPSAEVAPGVYTVVPKDGVEIIGVVTTGGTNKTVTGLYKGDASVDLDNSKKLADGKYIFVTLKEGYTFEETDVLIIDLAAKSDLGGGTKALEITTGIGNIDGAVWKSIAFDDYDGSDTISLEGIALGQTSIGLKRSANQNAKVNGIKVLRPMKPMLTAITINERVGVIDEANKTVAVTIPYEADLAALTVVPTIAWNEAAAANSIVVNNGGAWVENPNTNTYKLTDKDGDYTVYTITLTRDVQKFVVTYFDGETNLGTEEVEKDGHPTATGIVAPTKKGKIFLGWNQSSTATAAEDLNDITITEAKNLYAIYEDIDCSGTGVKFSMTPKANELTENYEPKGNEERDYAEYATLVGGKVFINNVDASNKRISVLKETSHIKFEGGDDGYIHVELDCPLNENDTIKIVNDQKWQVSVAKGSGYVAKAKADKYHVVPAAWDGKYDFYIKRDGSSLTISGIQVIRPAKYTVSFDMMGHGTQIADIEDVLEGSKIFAPTAPTDANYSFAGWYKENTLANEWKFDVDVVEANTTLYAKWLDKSDATLKSLKYGETEITLEAGVYEYNIGLPALTAAVPTLTAETSNPNAGKAIANADAFDSEGNATSTVTVTPEVGAYQVYTVNFSKLAALPQVNVTGSTTWNFSAGGSTTLTNQSDVVLANLPGINNDENFNSQALFGSFNKLEGTYFQGSKLSFTTEVAGKLTITFRGTNSNARHLQVCVGDGETVVADWNYNNNSTSQTKTIFVPEGKVTLKAFEGDVAQNARIYNMIFNATPDYTRDVTEGRYGTICLPNGGVMVGATLYEVAYYGQTSKKIFFDEILNGEMVAGVPYIFLPKEGASQLAVYYTDEANESAKNANGLHGFIGANADAEMNVPVGAYILNANQYREVVTLGTAKIKSNRSYIVLEDINPSEPALAPGRRRISMSVYSEQVATGIENTGFESEAPRKVLINGELFIIRGEKMYDAKGQLVK